MGPPTNAEDPPDIVFDTPIGASWESILTNDALAQAVKAIEAVAQSLAVSKRRQSIEDGSLASGDAGVALFYLYLWRWTGVLEHRIASERAIERSLTWINQRKTAPSLYHGFVGTAWVVEHAGRMGLWADDRVTSKLDELLVTFVDSSAEYMDFDLLRGTVGIGIYGLERMLRTGRTELIERVVAALARQAVIVPGGIAWPSRPQFLLGQLREAYPEGVFNLGMAHGTPGVIAFLSVVVEATGLQKARDLLASSIEWLLLQKLDRGDPSHFFSWVGVDGRSREGPARLAWCYGDPGIALAFSIAGGATSNPPLAALSLQLSHSALSADIERAPRAPCLCHGAGGLAVIYRRLYECTGLPSHLEGCRSWVRRLLSQRIHEAGIGGFCDWDLLDPSDPQSWSWKPVEGFLNGAAGVGLALLMMVSDKRPHWDTVLLLSDGR